MILGVSRRRVTDGINVPGGYGTAAIPNSATNSFVLARVQKFEGGEGYVYVAAVPWNANSGGVILGGNWNNPEIKVSRGSSDGGGLIVTNTSESLKTIYIGIIEI